MENWVFKVVLVVTFILKIPTGTIVCCFRPLNSGVKKITQASGRKPTWKHGGEKLPLFGERGGPAALRAGTRRATQTGL